MKQLLLLFILCVFISTANAKDTSATLPQIESSAFSKKLQKTLKLTVPVIGVEELAANADKYLLLDTREKEEYDTSHIPNAKFSGYKKFDWTVLKNTPKDQAIVVYCSVGLRSEKIGEKLKKKGFTNVKNLYGSIFEWANKAHPIIDQNGKKTKNVHTYNKNWSRWVKDGELNKVW